MRKILLVLLILVTTQSSIYAQEDLIKKIINNKSNNTNFQFTLVKQLDNTTVKQQGSSGTCWSYAGNSFLESEIYKKHKRVLDIAEIYTARKTYEEKAKNYVMMDGFLNYGDGGSLHDVINMYKKYGIMPQEAYTGLINGAVKNNFKEMQIELKNNLDKIIAKKAPINTNWTINFSSILDKYLGKVPETFIYNGKEYTSKTFAEEIVDLDPDDYIEITSFKDYEYYKQFYPPLPDNWSGDKMYNIPMAELTDCIDHALSLGYTVCWATDVSEAYFSWKNGLAYVPDTNLYAISSEERANLFTHPKPEKIITEEMRQEAINNKSTTDDHAMHIVGISKDQNGKEYYLIKNSWGDTNDFKGYLYVTKTYVQFKTTAILLNKNALPKKLRKKLNLMS